MRRSIWCTLITVALLVVTGAPALAVGEPAGVYGNQPYPWRSVTMYDGWTDTGGPDDGAELTDASVRYDPTTGQVDWQLRSWWATDPTFRYGGILGHWSAGSCVADIVVLHQGGTDVWGVPNTSTNGMATSEIRTSTHGSAGSLRIHAATGIKQSAVTCAEAKVQSSSGSSTYDIVGPESLVTKPRPRPVLAISSPAPVLGPRGKTVKVKITVKNTGSATADGVRLVVIGGRPATKRFSLGTIAAHRSRTVKVKVAIAKRKRNLTMTATARDALKMVRKIAVRPEIALAPGASLAGRYFWHTETVSGQGWSNSGIAFVDKRWAYLGFPGAGLPRCTVQTSDGRSDGCVQYSWKKGGVLRVGKVKGRYSGGLGLNLGGKGYLRLGVPKKGARFNFTLVHKDFSGYYPNIVTWSDYLSMSRNGRFIRSSTMIGSLGAGSPTTWSSTSNSSKGTYAIGPRGRLTLRYADGAVRTSTMGLAYHKGRPDASYGVMLGSTNFYR